MCFFLNVFYEECKNYLKHHAKCSSESWQNNCSSKMPWRNRWGGKSKKHKWGSSCPGSTITAAPMGKNWDWMNSVNQRKWDKRSKLKQQNTAGIFKLRENKKIPVIHFHTYIFGISSIYTCIETCTETHAFLEKKTTRSTEHAHSILATRPELDGTGSECLSYATLHFNNRRTGQSVFMTRQWKLAEEKQVSGWNSLSVSKHTYWMFILMTVIHLFWWFLMIHYCWEYFLL